VLQEKEKKKEERKKTVGATRSICITDIYDLATSFPSNVPPSGQHVTYFKTEYSIQNAF